MVALDVHKVAYVFFVLIYSLCLLLPFASNKESTISIRTQNIQTQVNAIFSRLALLDTKPIRLMAPSGCTEVMEC